MRRLVSTTVILGVIFVGGILFGQNFSLDMPGISVGGGGGDPAPAREAITDTIQEKAEEVQAEVQKAQEAVEALGDFKIVLKEDRIYHNDREITMEELDALIAQAKEQGGIIEVEYDAESVTGRFVEQLRDTLNAAEVRNIGISR